MSRDDVPADIAAERAVIGAILAPGGYSDGRLLANISRRVQPEHFYRPAHATILTAALRLAGRGNEVDAVTIGRELADTNNLQRIGGLPHLAALAGESNGLVLAHLDIIREQALRRNVLKAGQALGQLANTYDADLGAEALVERMRKLVDDVAADALDDTARTGQELADILDERLESYTQDREPGISTGWPDVDQHLDAGSGLQPGRLYVIAGRPGTGKSIVGAHLATQAALAQVRSLLVSLEMNRDELADRIISALARVDSERIKRRQLDEQDWADLRAARQRYGRAPCWLEDDPHLGLARITTKARDLTRGDSPLGLIVVDYLQLIQAADTRARREEQVAGFSRGLKVIAKEFGVPVVALAQLNRDVERRTDKTPVLSDLRESGTLEQDADVVLLLEHKAEGDTEELLVHFAKNRGGPRGRIVRLGWQPHLSRAVSQHRHQEDIA